ncbi:ABC transporter ATP-binding protein [Paenibacillus albicereus]|uniref:ABC transporter ATP-binding protein n=1 Tax=Paenibacillus albicereus TaxID=2726185 RepID=UPI001F39431E|nr:ABC transporter ATP-binding protein [Paenibacillus albicereus]
MRVRGLRKSYGAKQVLKGIDLEAYPGQIIGYIGPNGAGKSTTQKLMLGLEQGYDGYIEVLGHDISDGSSEYKARIGYVPETAEIYDMLTAREYLAFSGQLYGLPREAAERKAERLLALFGLEEMVDRRIDAFSKGMRQKVMLSAAVLHDPDVLFLDEPLSGLDAGSVAVVKEILARLAARGKAIFYSSHIMDVVEKISSRIVLLHDGKVAADGSFAELQARSEGGSLERIFTRMTGFHEQEAIAERFCGTVAMTPEQLAEEASGENERP